VQEQPLRICRDATRRLRDSVSGLQMSPMRGSASRAAEHDGARMLDEMESGGAGDARPDDAQGARETARPQPLRGERAVAAVEAAATAEAEAEAEACPLGPVLQDPQAQEAGSPGLGVDPGRASVNLFAEAPAAPAPARLPVAPAPGGQRTVTSPPLPAAAPAEML
jgi:hypothetical protein